MRPVLSLLEEFPNLSALPATWREAAGDHYAALKILCLDPAPKIALSIKCPRNCGCRHRLIMRHDKTAVLAACRCEPAACPDFEVSVEDATPLRINRARLGRAICRALDCPSKPVDLGIENTTQIGSWSADAVPIILTLEGAPVPFRNVIADLVASLGVAFILISPTADQLDARGQQHLLRVKAGLFALETIFTLTPSGLLLPVKAPGELFMKFNPQPKDTDLSVYERTFALLRALDIKIGTKEPTLVSVFIAYCMHAMTISAAANELECSRSTILSRLDVIRHKAGIDPEYLRSISGHLTQMADSLSDPRAHNHHPIDPDALG